MKCLLQLCFDFYMIEAKPPSLAIAPMMATRSMTSYAKTAWRWSRRTDPIAASAPRKMDAGSAICQALVGRTLLRLDTMAASDSCPLEVLSEELPWLRATRLPPRPLQTILR
jgi:hypothetical protein